MLYRPRRSGSTYFTCRGFVELGASASGNRINIIYILLKSRPGETRGWSFSQQDKEEDENNNMCGKVNKIFTYWLWWVDASGSKRKIYC